MRLLLIINRLVAIFISIYQVKIVFLWKIAN